MADNFGSGVSRVLDPKQTAFLEVIWQQGKPPLDSELNLIQQLQADWRQQLVLRGTPSGFLGNETNTSKDFVTNASWSNWFKFGRQRSGEKQSIMWAAVNGWLIPVTGTLTGTPPGSQQRGHLEQDHARPFAVQQGDFRADCAPGGLVGPRAPGPSSSTALHLGHTPCNVEGAILLADDIQDLAIGVETSQRGRSSTVSV